MVDCEGGLYLHLDVRIFHCMLERTPFASVQVYALLYSFIVFTVVCFV